MQDLGFKIVKTNGGDELLARIGNYEICKAAFEKAMFVYPSDHLEMRQGARVILNRANNTSEGMPKRFISGLPNSVREGRVLMHNHVSHGPNWPTGPNGFRAWTDDKPPLGFVPCPCGWAGLPHYAREDHARAYRGSPKLYQRRVRLLEKKQAVAWGKEESSGTHKWG